MKLKMQCCFAYPKYRYWILNVFMNTFYLQEKDLGDEYGWKQVHGDVFRPASNPMLFSALIGSGYHISVVALCVITFSMVGELYTELVLISLYLN